MLIWWLLTSENDDVVNYGIWQLVSLMTVFSENDGDGDAQKVC